MVGQGEDPGLLGVVEQGEDPLTGALPNNLYKCLTTPSESQNAAIE